MVKKGLKNWFSERYTQIKVVQDYEQEKENAITLLEKEKIELEESLAQFDLHSQVIDYEGIEHLSFNGNVAYVSTKGERYTVRLNQDEDLMTFIKNLRMPNANHAFVERERWLITTPIGLGVKAETLPKLDFLTLYKENARLSLDLKKDVDVLFVKGILETIQGEFSLSLNLEKANATFAQLVEVLNHWHPYDFTIKVDATDIRSFTFFVESAEGYVYNLEAAGYFNVEELLFDQTEFTDNAKKALEQALPIANRVLQAIKRQKEKEAMLQTANEKLNELNLTYTKVELTVNENRSVLELGLLQDPVRLYARAHDSYFDVLRHIETIKQMAENETTEVATLLNGMRLVESASKSFSIKDQYITTSITSEQVTQLQEQARKMWFQQCEKRLHTLFDTEQPAIKEVLYRFEISQQVQTTPYSLTTGIIDPFITLTAYEELVHAVRHVLFRLATMEFSEEYHELTIMPNASLFACELKKRYTTIKTGEICVVLSIKKGNAEPYERYFLNGRALPTRLVEKLKKI